jgi:hypothetical protein
MEYKRITDVHGHEKCTQWIHVIYESRNHGHERNTQWIHANVDHSHEWIHNGAMSHNQIKGYLEPIK